MLLLAYFFINTFSLAKDIEISLSKNVIQKIPFDSYPKDFTFIVDDCKYYTSRIEADILSPIIRDFHFSNYNQKSINIDTHNLFPDCNFSDFLSLLTFEPRTIDIKLQLYFKYLFSYLGNYEECEKIQIQYNESITVKNVIQRIKQKKLVYQLNYLTEEIDFVANHFYEINKDELKKLDDDIIEMIIQNDNLKIKDEDSLLQFIIDLYNENNTRKNLFENVYYSKVSQKEIMNFFTTFDFNDITPEIWQSIIQRTNNSENNQTSRKLKEWKIKKILYKKNQNLNGIIKYLTKKAGGNIVKKEIINITSSGDNSYSYLPSNLVDFDDLSSNSMWKSDNSFWPSVTFDFINKKVKLFNYSLHTPSDDTGNYPRSWIVECSNNLNHWFTVDVRKDESVMNHPNVSHVFECKYVPNDYFRYIRIFSNDHSWNSNSLFYFDISAVEFFGFLIKKNFSFPN